ncbi:hypothetical protein BDW66DRAFT_155357 [Aspergillus desertorum]
MLAPASQTSSLFSEEILKYHLDLLDTKAAQNQGRILTDEAALAPIIASSALWRLQARDRDRKLLSASSRPDAAGEEDLVRGSPNPSAASSPSSSLQYGLLAGSRQEVHSIKKQLASATTAAGTSTSLLSPTYSSINLDTDPRLLFNVSTPSSTFICGSQGSGKSHTLSCLLESCLIPSKLGRLTKPLTGVVFHYDTFISDTGGTPCEAAYLASNKSLNVRVLCAPTNVATIRASQRITWTRRTACRIADFEIYKRLNVSVEPLSIDQSDLNTKRMMDLMAVSAGDAPLYMESVKRILRELRMVQQQVGGGFDYAEFRKRVKDCGLTAAQMGPLTQRLETLESFMPDGQTNNYGCAKGKGGKGKGGKGKGGKAKKGKGKGGRGTDWTPSPGQLTIVDLSCPCVSPETACALFNICLGIFLQQDVDVGRVFALDEAHKYMSASPEAVVFTETILSAVRLQRHLGVRAIVSTQEPTISTALLNLCSVTIVHRFTSPEWLRVLRHHLAAAAEGIPGKTRAISASGGGERSPGAEEDKEATLFDLIVKLKVGEALLFAPSAIVGVCEEDGALVLERLGGDYLAIKVRERLTEDGGRSVLSL